MQALPPQDSAEQGSAATHSPSRRQQIPWRMLESNRNNNSPPGVPRELTTPGRAAFPLMAKITSAGAAGPAAAGGRSWMEPSTTAAPWATDPQ